MFAALREFESFYEAMHPAQENSESCFAFFTGLPHPLFNCVMHLRDEEKLEALLPQTMTFWMHSENRPATLRKTLEKKGFHPVMKCPLMSSPVKPVPLGKEVIKRASLDDFLALLAVTFHLDDAVKEGLHPMLKRSRAENYLLYLEGQPVATGTLLNGGIFNISTLPAFQKRGCGTAMTRFLMQRAYELKLEKLLLLSTPEAAPLYSRLGFNNCLEIDIYSK